MENILGNFKNLKLLRCVRSIDEEDEEVLVDSHTDGTDTGASSTNATGHIQNEEDKQSIAHSYTDDKDSVANSAASHGDEEDKQPIAHSYTEDKDTVANSAASHGDEEDKQPIAHSYTEDKDTVANSAASHGDEEDKQPIAHLYTEDKDTVTSSAAGHGNDFLLSLVSLNEDKNSNTTSTDVNTCYKSAYILHNVLPDSSYIMNANDSVRLPTYSNIDMPYDLSQSSWIFKEIKMAESSKQGDIKPEITHIKRQISTEIIVPVFKKAKLHTDKGYSDIERSFSPIPYDESDKKNSAGVYHQNHYKRALHLANDFSQLQNIVKEKTDKRLGEMNKYINDLKSIRQFLSIIIDRATIYFYNFGDEELAYCEYKAYFACSRKAREVFTNLKSHFKFENLYRMCSVEKSLVKRYKCPCKHDIDPLGHKKIKTHRNTFPFSQKRTGIQNYAFTESDPDGPQCMGDRIRPARFTYRFEQRAKMYEQMLATSDDDDDDVTREE